MGFDLMGKTLDYEHFYDGRVILWKGDCLEIIPGFMNDSFDSICTDPPYHLASIVKRFGKEGSAPAQFGSDGAYARASRGFMGKEWDGGDIAFQPETWVRMFKVLKPGGYLIAFGATRNYHRMACAIEDAGFEVRDTIMWLYGTGFPKSHDVSKGIDATLIHGNSHSRSMKKANESRPGDGRTIASLPNNGIMSEERHARVIRDEASTDEAKQWQGWGTALKPACEPIILARKPLSEKTVAANVLRWGTGAINVDGCRIGTGQDKIDGGCAGTNKLHDGGISNRTPVNFSVGRWPANVIHDGSDEVVEAFPDNKSVQSNRGNLPDMRGDNFHRSYDQIIGSDSIRGYTDAGSAARFFYSAKADGADRITTKHPTVKPVDLMRYLVRLVTPPGGTVLDPFAGSGTTGEAALKEGFNAVLIEREKEYQDDIAVRMRFAFKDRNFRRAKNKEVKARPQQENIENNFDKMFE